MGEILVNYPNFFDKAFDKFSAYLGKAVSRFNDAQFNFIMNIPNKIHKTGAEYILDINVRKDYVGRSAHIKQRDLNRAFKTAETILEKCERQPSCFLHWDETITFTDGNGAYAFFWTDYKTKTKLEALHLVGLNKNQDEKVSGLLRKLNLPFFITRDLLTS